MMESLEGELAFKQLLGRQIQLSVLCPGLVASGIWDLARQEAQRAPAESRQITARATQKQFFDEVGTPAAECVQCFLAGVRAGQFICDSVEGQAQAIFEQRASYIRRGLMPSQLRTRM